MGFPSLITTTSVQHRITLSGEFLLTDSLTLWPPDLRKKDSRPAPGPALGVVVLVASRSRILVDISTADAHQQGFDFGIHLHDCAPN